jgi:dynein intermediate chain 1, axonemal
VYDLSVNKYSPICEQQVVKKTKLTRISFNTFEPVLIVGDERGDVVSLKLSPNLRRASGREEEIEKLEGVVNAVRGVSAY